MWADPKEINESYHRTPNIGNNQGGITTLRVGRGGSSYGTLMHMKAAIRSPCSGREEPSHPGNLIGCLPLTSLQCSLLAKPRTGMMDSIMTSHPGPLDRAGCRVDLKKQTEGN